MAGEQNRPLIENLSTAPARAQRDECIGSRAACRYDPPAEFHESRKAERNFSTNRVAAVLGFYLSFAVWLTLPAAHTESYADPAVSPLGDQKWIVGEWMEDHATDTQRFSLRTFLEFNGGAWVEQAQEFNEKQDLNSETLLIVAQFRDGVHGHFFDSRTPTIARKVTLESKRDHIEIHDSESLMPLVEYDRVEGTGEIVRSEWLSNNGIRLAAPFRRTIKHGSLAGVPPSTKLSDALASLEPLTGQFSGTWETSRGRQTARRNAEILLAGNVIRTRTEIRSSSDPGPRLELSIIWSKSKDEFGELCYLPPEGIGESSGRWQERVLVFKSLQEPGFQVTWQCERENALKARVSSLPADPSDRIIEMQFSRDKSD